MEITHVLRDLVKASEDALQPYQNAAEDKAVLERLRMAIAQAKETIHQDDQLMGSIPLKEEAICPACPINKLKP